MRMTAAAATLTTQNGKRDTFTERERDKFVASRLEMGTAINPGMYKYLYVCVHIYIYIHTYAHM